MDDMTDGKVITVAHEVAHGWHEFTCPQVPGFHLIAEDADLETAYAQVPDAIAEIIDADDGTITTVVLENSYSEYLAKIPDAMRPSIRHYTIRSKAAA